MNFYGTFVFVSFLLLIFILVRSINTLLRKGITPGSKRKINPVTFLLYPGFVIILFTWIFEIIRIAFQFPFFILPQKVSTLLFNSVFLRISGVLIVILSLLFLKVTLAHFGNSLRFGLDENNKGKLITTGIFSVSRNPFFLSLDLYFYGIALIFPNMFFVGFAILTIISIHLFILKEEKFLHRVYGEEYENYSKKVKRYIDVSKRN